MYLYLDLDFYLDSDLYLYLYFDFPLRENCSQEVEVDLVVRWIEHFLTSMNCICICFCVYIYISEHIENTVMFNMLVQTMNASEEGLL